MEPTRSLAGYPVILPNIRDVRLRLAVVTSSLHVLGQTSFGFNLSIAQILVTLATSAIIEFTIVFRRDKLIMWPASALLTGNSVALILRVPGTTPGDWWSMRGWYIFAGTAAFAIASKYVIRYRGQQIFNPSNFALVVAFIVLGEERADPQILWWGSWSLPLAIALAVILGGSIAVTMKVGHLRTAISFWVPYAAMVGLVVAVGHTISTNWHVGPLAGWPLWVTLAASPEVLVFVFYMISDPKSSPRADSAKPYFGLIIALFSALFVASQDSEFGTKVGILAGLVAACPFVPLLDSLAGINTQHKTIRRFHKDLVFQRPIVLSLSCLGALALTAGSLVLLARPDSSESEVASSGSNRRAEVAFDSTALPEVAIVSKPGMSSMTITPDLAEKVAFDVAHGLLVEATAIRTLDLDLARQATIGVRLEQASAEIKTAKDRPDINPNPSWVESYAFERLEVTLIKVDSGPQTPPQLAVAIGGHSTLIDGRSLEFATTFTVAEVGDVYLISNAFDPDGKPVGRQRGGSLPAIDQALPPPAPTISASELDGLRFRDASDEWGLLEPHSPERLEEGPEAMSGGVAVGDYDADGDADLLITRVNLSNILYRNDGVGFTDVTSGSGLDITGPDQQSTGALWVDIDGDGSLDLVTVGLGRTPHRLFLGDGTGRFLDATERWRLPSAPSLDPDSATFGVSAGDFDRDGLIDIILAGSDVFTPLEELRSTGVKGRDMCSKKARTAVATNSSGRSQTILLRNTGDSFEDRSSSLGIDPATIMATNATFGDLNGDDWPDLLVSGQLCTSKFLINDRAGGFHDATASSRLEGRISTANGGQLLDINQDGFLDWIVSGVSYPTRDDTCPLTEPRWGCGGNRVFVNDGDGRFRDDTARYGINDGLWSWGIAAADFNNDFRTGIFFANGFESVASWAPAGTYPDSELFERSRNSGNQFWISPISRSSETPSDKAVNSAFDQVSSIVGLSDDSNSKASVPADFNGDGKLDLIVANTNAPPSLFINETDVGNNWLEVDLYNETSSNRNAVGSTITVSGAWPNKLVRSVIAGGSFQSGNPLRQHFGIGRYAIADQVVIDWPDGQRQVLRDVPANQVLRVVRR